VIIRIIVSLYEVAMEIGDLHLGMTNQLVAISGSNGNTVALVEVKCHGQLGVVFLVAIGYDAVCSSLLLAVNKEQNAGTLIVAGVGKLLDVCSEHVHSSHWRHVYSLCRNIEVRWVEEHVVELDVCIWIGTRDALLQTGREGITLLDNWN